MSEKTVTMSINNTDENYSNYLLRCVQLILNAADEGKLAVVDCYNKAEEIVPVLCVVVDDKNAIFPVAQLFRMDQEPASLYNPVANQTPEKHPEAEDAEFEEATE